MTAAASRGPADPPPTIGHACALFRGEEDEYRAFHPFVVECVERGERCVHVTAGRIWSERLRRLEASGLDTALLRSGGKLDVRDWGDIYLPGGSFDVQAQLVRTSEILRQANAASGRARLWADMGWCLAGAPGSEGWLEYESRINDVIGDEPALVVCAYDVRFHDARVVLDLLHTHPFVLLGGALRANPLYVPPGKFLPELHARSGREPH